MGIDEAIKEIRELREADEYVERMEKRNEAIETLIHSLSIDDFAMLSIIMDCQYPQTHSHKEYMLRSIMDERK